MEFAKTHSEDPAALKVIFSSIVLIMKLSMTGQKKCDFSIQVTAKAGLTVVCIEH
jgi:hypothetical protein